MLLFGSINLRSQAKKILPVLFVAATVAVLVPALAHASVETSLIGLKTKLTGVILPLLSVIGLALAAVSFFTGNPQAKQHVVYAILGCVFGFGAQAIVDLIASTVR
jgi:hypothetical protein